MSVFDNLTIRLWDEFLLAAMWLVFAMYVPFEFRLSNKQLQLSVQLILVYHPLCRDEKTKLRNYHRWWLFSMWIIADNPQICNLLINFYRINIEWSTTNVPNSHDQYSRQNDSNKICRTLSHFRHWRWLHRAGAMWVYLIVQYFEPTATTAILLVLIKQHRRLLLLWLLLPLLAHIYPASHGGDGMNKQTCERLRFAVKKRSNAPTSILFCSHALIAIERGSNNRILFRYDLRLCVA